MELSRLVYIFLKREEGERQRSASLLFYYHHHLMVLESFEIGFVKRKGRGLAWPGDKGMIL